MLKTNAEELRNEFAPLYCRYPGQCNAQTAYVTLDPEDRTLTADYDHEIGNAIPMRVWHYRMYRITVSPFLSGKQVADLLEDEDFQKLAETVIAGYECNWDGSNMKGALTDEAQDALEEMERIAADIDGELIAMNAADYVEPIRSEITAEMTDREIAEKVIDLKVEARVNNIIIEGDIEKLLREQRDWMRD